MKDIGPVQMLVGAFGPDVQFDGEILRELDHLEFRRLVRVLDVLFVSKDPTTGDLVALDYQGPDRGGVVAAILELDLDREPAPAPVGAATERVHGLTPEGVLALAEALDPGWSAVFVLIEHRWAGKLKNAFRVAGGIALADGLLTPEALVVAGAALAAMPDPDDEAGDDNA
jgi:hypothetical protein